MKLKKKICVILAFSLFILTGCKNQKDNYEYYTKNFIGAFDTITTYITYATNQDDFDKQCELIDKDLNYYNQLFDKYNSYDGVNNVKTINDNAGKKAIKVDKPLIDLLELSIERYEKYLRK